MRTFRELSNCLILLFLLGILGILTESRTCQSLNIFNLILIYLLKFNFACYLYDVMTSGGNLIRERISIQFLQSLLERMAN